MVVLARERHEQFSRGDLPQACGLVGGGCDDLGAIGAKAGSRDGGAVAG